MQKHVKSSNISDKRGDIMVKLFQLGKHNGMRIAFMHTGAGLTDIE
jgi:hypothetical protein